MFYYTSLRLLPTERREWFCTTMRSWSISYSPRWRSSVSMTILPKESQPFTNYICTYPFTDGGFSPNAVSRRLFGAHPIATVSSTICHFQGAHLLLSSVIVLCNSKELGPAYSSGVQLFSVSGRVGPASFVDVDYLDFFFPSYATICAT
jgi:hypothetical protein